MTKEEANTQLAAFFSRLGEKAFTFAATNYVKARVGEALIGFEYDAFDGVLSSRALIYRFRRAPQDEVLDALFGEETELNSGGGRIVFDSEDLSLFLQRDFAEKIDDAVFSAQVNQLARASLVWSSEIVEHAAAKVSASS